MPNHTLIAIENGTSRVVNDHGDIVNIPTIVRMESGIAYFHERDGEFVYCGVRPNSDATPHGVVGAGLEYLRRARGREQAMSVLTVRTASMIQRIIDHATDLEDGAIDLVFIDGDPGRIQWIRVDLHDFGQFQIYRGHEGGWYAYDGLLEEWGDTQEAALSPIAQAYLDNAGPYQDGTL